MTRPAAHNQTEGLREALLNVPLDRGLRRAAFDLVRVLKVYFSEPNPAFQASMPILEDLAEGEGWDSETLVEEIFMTWPRVRHAADSDPVSAAFLWAKSQRSARLPGIWPPSQKFKRDAAVTMLMCRRLGHEGQPFFLSCRKLAGLLGCDFTRAAALLRTMIKNEILVVHTEATKTRAAYYRLGPRGRQ